MKKSCKLLGLILVMCMLLAMFAGCTSGGGNTPPPTNQTESGITEGTDPTENTEPTDGGEVADPTDPTDPIQGENPTGNTDATEESDATDSGTETPSEGETPNVTPPATEVPTDPTVAPTVAPTEAPTDPPHTHKYEKKVTKPTCEKKGYTKYTCSCGDSYKDAYTDKLTHSYQDTVVKATCEAQGYTLHKCSACGDSYKDCYTEKGAHNYKLTSQHDYYHLREHGDVYHCTVCGYRNIEYSPLAQEEVDAFCREVETAIVKYLNQYRVEQGDTEMEYLPGMSQVAQYRAVQLADDFGHSITLLKEAHGYYQYGKYMDATEYGDDASLSYWDSNCKEAIVTAVSGCDADFIAESAVLAFRNSSGHWSYLGSSDYKYVGVGYYCDASGGYVCILQPDANYG